MLLYLALPSLKSNIWWRIHFLSRISQSVSLFLTWFYVGSLVRILDGWEERRTQQGSDQIQIGIRFHNSGAKNHGKYPLLFFLSIIEGWSAFWRPFRVDFEGRRVSDMTPPQLAGLEGVVVEEEAPPPLTNQFLTTLEPIFRSSNAPISHPQIGPRVWRIHLSKSICFQTRNPNMKPKSIGRTSTLSSIKRSSSKIFLMCKCIIFMMTVRRWNQPRPIRDTQKFVRNCQLSWKRWRNCYATSKTGLAYSTFPLPNCATSRKPKSIPPS